MKAPDVMRAAPPAVMPAFPVAPDARWLARLPHRESLDLDPVNAAPGVARRWLGRFLPEWSLAEYLDVSSVIASELITNSVASVCQVPWPAGPPPVRLSLSAGPLVVAVLCWDATRAAPAPRAAADSDESGRGLALIAGLSAGCGYYFPGKSPGKVTWAVIENP
jgi:hypothetical protein